MSVAAAIRDGVVETTAGDDTVVCAVVVAVAGTVAALAALNIQDGIAPPPDEEVSVTPLDADDCADSLLLVSRAVTL